MEKFLFKERKRLQIGMHKSHLPSLDILIVGANRKNVVKVSQYNIFPDIATVMYVCVSTPAMFLPICYIKYFIIPRRRDRLSTIRKSVFLRTILRATQNKTEMSSLLHVSGESAVLSFVNWLTLSGAEQSGLRGPSTENQEAKQAAILCIKVLLS